MPLRANPNPTCRTDAAAAASVAATVVRGGRAAAAAATAAPTATAAAAAAAAYRRRSAGRSVARAAGRGGAGRVLLYALWHYLLRLHVLWLHLPRLHSTSYQVRGKCCCEVVVRETLKVSDLKAATTLRGYHPITSYVTDLPPLGERPQGRAPRCAPPHATRRSRRAWRQ